MDDNRINQIIGDNPRGAWAYIDRGVILKDLAKKYGRDTQNLCAKVFYKDWGMTGWSLDEVTKFQNICHIRGLAPRVYALDRIDWYGKKVFVQLTDFVPGGFETDPEKFSQMYQRIFAICKEFGGLKKQGEDHGMINAVNGQWVDFQMFGLDPYKHKQYVTDLVKKNVFGFVYQDIPDLDIKATRDINSRVLDFKLNKIDFKGKTVLDIGCSSGMFMKYALKRGAKRVVGIEFPELALANKELFNYLGLFNADFIGRDARQLTSHTIKEYVGIDKFDYVFAFSITVHMGTPDFMFEVVGDTMFFEKSGGDIGETEEGAKRLIKHYKSTKIKNTSDRDREAYILKK